MANWARMAKSPSAPPTNIGFLSSKQNAASGGTFPSFPAVTGDFNGDGFPDAAAIVNNPSMCKLGASVYCIAAEMNDGKGNFTTVLTPTGAVEQDPIFAGNLSGHTNGEDDVLIVHPYPSGSQTTIEAWLSNGDGTFKSAGTFAATKNGFVWATVDASGNVILADAATPNGNICTLTNTGKGVFSAPTCVAFTGALNAGSVVGVPGNPMVFADFNGDGSLDFAAPAAAGGTAAANQIVVYLCSGKTNPCSGYTGPTALTTKDGVYDSCFLGGGPLKTGGNFGELVSANCLDNNITVYVNNAGTFTAQPYVSAASNPIGVTIADVNGDGDTDIVASCSRSADIKVLLGDGTGTVAPASVGYVTGGSPLVPPLVAAFHGDTTKPDVVVPDNEFSFVYLEGYGDGSFRSAVNYYSEPGAGPRAAAVNIASGDFNGDGIPDFVIGNAPIGSTAVPSYSITVFLSNSNRSLNPGVNYYNSAFTNYSLQYVAVADFNGAGKPLDIAATDNFNHVVQIFNGNGDGTFTVGATYSTDTATGANPNPVGLVVGDFNGDGWPDLAVINNYGAPASSAKVGILINNKKGGFNPAVTYPLSTVATEITAAALLKTNGNLDLVVPLYGTSTAPGSAVAIFLGNGDGTFKPESDVSLGTYRNPYDAAVGDLNGDGKVDLAVTIEDQSAHPQQGIAVALGNGDGTFQAPTLLPSTVQPPLDNPLPGYVKIVDLNQDGIPDLVYSNSQFSTVGILYGEGGTNYGHFYSPVEFPADRWAWGLALVDLYGDGATDVVVSGNSLDFSGVAVLFNDGGNNTTLTSSANPSTSGTPVTFTATVASPVRGVTAIPTGKVTFYDGSTALGSANLSSGVAAFPTSSLAPSTTPHSITAQYSGDVNFLPKTSAAVNQTVLVPQYSLTASTGSPVNPGSPATFTINQKGTNAYNGTVSYPASACSGLPAGTACSFSPSMITGTGTTTLTISTAGPTGALIAPPGQKGALDLWASLGGLGLVGMVLAGDWSSRKRRRMGILLAVLAVMLLITLVGCGGGSSSSGGGGGGGTGGTPAGSYPITVTVTGTAGNNGGSTSPTGGPLKLTLVVQ